MIHSRFSASVESFLSSVSSSSSASEDCECSECERINHTIARRPLSFRHSFPSSTKLQVPTAPLHTLPSSITLQKQKAQMTSMGYSKLFNLGYFSVTGALQSSG